MNRGVSGNKIPDLESRWQADCLDLKPAVLSILIGVNDLGHKLNEAVASGTEPSYWAADGVHPTPACHALMARTWRDVVGI